MSWNPNNDGETLYTDVHVETIKKAYETLSKHFDAFVIVTMLNSDDYSKEQARCQHHGGGIQAKGLLREGIKILDDCSTTLE